ncbi:MAG TPA: OmpA family protein [Steroidobacter sp.]|nr:OmpA family protein [Steroidobacter sp.]
MPAFLARPTRRRALTSAAIAIAAVVGIWALFVPPRSCSDSACARERFRVFVEIDTFDNIEPLTLAIEHQGVVHTPSSILGGGGVRVEIVQDQTNLPYAAASGPLDRADLDQYAQVWRTRKPPRSAHAGVYAMATPALVSDTGEPLFGIMFDVQGREGFAIAPGETARAFSRSNPEAIGLLQLRTFTHELLHALNRRHLDAMQTDDGRLTIEAPTRCISKARNGRWELVEAPLLELSPTTIQFFQSAPKRYVLPGGAHAPYSDLQTSASECEDVRRNTGVQPAPARWELIRKHLARWFWLQSAYAQVDPSETDPQAAPDALEEHEPAASIELRLQAQEAAYPLGYPIAVRVRVFNAGEGVAPLRDRLSPSYGLVQFEARETGEDDDAWRPIEPLAWYEPASDGGAMLQPGEASEQTVPIYFGEGGWTFPRPGEYEVRARLLMSAGEEHGLSNIVLVRIAAPRTEADEQALTPLLDEDGELNERMGRLLMFGGRIGMAGDRAALVQAARAQPETALGAALRLALVSQELSPPIDPRTGERRPPDRDRARELLHKACPDSGATALRDQVLERFEGLGAQAMGPRLASNAAAWEGVTEAGEAAATYGDPSLERFGPSLHFCAGAASFSAAVQARALSLGARLRELDPQRVVVVGHADDEGDCSDADELAMRRAHELRRVLIEAGVAPERIVGVSLGARRPLDFSTSEPARLLNRRVEALLEFRAERSNDGAVDLSDRPFDDQAERPELDGDELAGEPAQLEEEDLHALPECDE